MKYNVSIHYDVEDNALKGEVPTAKKRIKKLHEIRKTMLKHWERVIASQVRAYNKRHQSKSYWVVEVYRHDKSSDRRMSSSYQWDRVLIYIRGVIVDYIRTVRLAKLSRCTSKVDKYAECSLNMFKFITICQKQSKDTVLMCISSYILLYDKVSDVSTMKSTCYDHRVRMD